MKADLRLWHERRHAQTDARVLEAVRAQPGGATAPCIACATGYGMTRVLLALARLEQEGTIIVSRGVSGGNRPTGRNYSAIEDSSPEYASAANVRP
jgi:hypothetical protein